MLDNVPKERSFARSGFTRKENVPVGLVDEPGSQEGSIGQRRSGLHAKGNKLHKVTKVLRRKGQC
jgi:hypothetical protein